MTRSILCTLVLAAVAAAQGDPIKTWKKEQSAIERNERRFWKDFKSRFSRAIEELYKPVMDAYDKPDEHKEALYDYGGIEALYREARSFAEQRAAADDVLVESGNEKAAGVLFAALLKSAKRMDSLESELLDSGPNYGRYSYNQEPGCELWALRTLTTRRAAALGKCAGAVPFLTADAWKKATRADGRKSFRRRVFVLDALRNARSEASLPFLQQTMADKSAAVRIAAIEAAAPHGEKAKEALGPAWNDSDPAVRRALIESLQPLPSWFGAVLKHGKGARGFERELCIQYLTTISRQPFGFDFARWDAWYADYKKELEGGKFDAKTIEVAETKPTPDPEAFEFYGVPISATGAAFVVQGARILDTPADVDFQKTRWRELWAQTIREWEDEHPSHRAILLREFQSAAAQFPKELRWGMVLLYGAFASKSIGEKSLLDPKPRDVKKGAALIEKAAGKGWCAEYQGMRSGAALGGKESDLLDTIILWSTGDPSGGRYMTSEVAADAWNRFNRFRRLRVIAIRVGNRKEPSEAFMKSIAEASRGVSLWADKPPAKK